MGEKRAGDGKARVPFGRVTPLGTLEWAPGPLRSTGPRPGAAVQGRKQASPQGEAPCGQVSTGARRRG